MPRGSGFFGQRRGSSWLAEGPDAGLWRQVCIVAPGDAGPPGSRGDPGALGTERGSGPRMLHSVGRISMAPSVGLFEDPRAGCLSIHCGSIRILSFCFVWLVVCLSFFPPPPHPPPAPTSPSSPTFHPHSVFMVCSRAGGIHSGVCAGRSQ